MRGGFRRVPVTVDEGLELGHSASLPVAVAVISQLVNHDDRSLRRRGQEGEHRNEAQDALRKTHLVSMPKPARPSKPGLPVGRYSGQPPRPRKCHRLLVSYHQLRSPMAIVILGGLLNSRSANFVVRPALFARCGQDAVRADPSQARG